MMSFKWKYTISPLTRKRLQNFMRIRRARWSLVALVALFTLSLFSELICNSRPLYLRFKGKSFLPFAQNLTHADLLREGAEAGRINFKALVASDEFKEDKNNRVLWTPVPYGPGEVLDAAHLRAYRTVRMSVVPEYNVGRLNLLSGLTVVMPVNCEGFFPGTPVVEGQRLDEHWVLPEELKSTLQTRLAGGADAARDFIVEHASQAGQRARITLPAVVARAALPASVRLTFRQPDPPELPFQLIFRQKPDGQVYPVSSKMWQKIPEKVRPKILGLAQEAFDGTAPQAVVAWKGRVAEVSCALSEIAWPFPPVKGHWMGIDSAGRDVFARVLYGMRTALLFGLILAVWAMAFGLLIGSLQGYFGGWVDIAGQRLTEIWSALPFLYVMIFIGAALGRSFMLLLICYSLFNWIGVSYYMRAEFLRLRSRSYVEAARCQGLSAPRIIFFHILPNGLTPLITLFPFSLIGAVGSLAALDFLGFGLPPLSPSWGELLQQARLFRWAWWLILFPSAALFVVMLLTVIVGEGLRDAFDPRQQSRME
ncbi:MAG: ABC transporter permease subunit [Kiritimatiellae bacterium]|nr:ABC transporter permease subunit [Kiritimatiellia bacterium]